MRRFILRRTLYRNAGVTLFEALIAVFIALYVFLALSSLFVMSWKWWHEILPRIEAQRIARIALAGIVRGTVDPTAGTYTIGTTTFSRRNGLENATAEPDIIESGSRINFRLTPDSANVRSFCLINNDETGNNAVYYIDDAGDAHMIRGSDGISSLTFEKYEGESNLIKVTATVERSISGTRDAPYTFTSSYNKLAYLRNVD